MFVGVTASTAEVVEEATWVDGRIVFEWGEELIEEVIGAEDEVILEETDALKLGLDTMVILLETEEFEKRLADILSVDDAPEGVIIGIDELQRKPVLPANVEIIPGEVGKLLELNGLLKVVWLPFITKLEL